MPNKEAGVLTIERDVRQKLVRQRAFERKELVLLADEQVSFNCTQIVRLVEKLVQTISRTEGEYLICTGGLFIDMHARSTRICL
jgi:hypothetical protein